MILSSIRIYEQTIIFRKSVYDYLLILRLKVIMIKGKVNGFSTNYNQY